MHVLLGIGGSDDAFRALARTLDRVREAGDELTVAVLENPAVAAGAGSVADRVEDELEAAGVEADVREVEGDPGPALVTLAETEGYDEIVIGGGQESPLGKIDVGRIAEYVVLNATVTVTLVR
ncbi:MAG: universal stress protein [Halobacteriales archaeon]|nr:universal stress protein [Halobacteriales archaeon]